MIRKETIQNILDAAKIEEVVSDFVSLKRRGANYVGLCPFHNEKTPSFTVSPAKGFYYCFGCSKGGGAVDFIMTHEHLSYPDALKYLAEKYHIEIVDEVQTEEERQMQSELESLYNLVAYAQKHFTNNLYNTEEGLSVGMSYFNERGFNQTIIKKFQLGYSPAAWDNLTKKALENGYKIQYLEKTGLSIKKEDGTYYDRFRERVIFPVHNLTGRVIGFTARILTSDKNKPKYINSPESDIYNKGKTLYGIFFAKQALVSNDNCLLVEGNTDVISLFQSGIENVVASSGTSLTTEQIRLIKKFTNNITIIYDGDEAGQKASLRGTDMIIEEGMNVRIVILPQGEDPDSFARKTDAIQIKKFIKENSANFILFKTKLLLDEAKTDPIKRAELIKEIVRTISLIPEPIHRSVYIKECGDLMQISEQSLINELNKHLRKKLKKNISQSETHNEEELVPPETIEYKTEKQFLPDKDDLSSLERYLMWIILNFGDENMLVETNNDGVKEIISKKAILFISQILKKNKFYFHEKILQSIYDEYIHIMITTGHSDILHFINHKNLEFSKTVISILSRKYELSKYWEEKYKIYTPRHEDDDRNVLVNDISNTINSINLHLITKEISDIKNEIKKLQKENSENPEILILLEKLKERQSTRAEISKSLGRVIN
ncbi:MAG: DNA primase [Bacteroidales bacterium]|jgi:DNA primase|nr:DNA primase [Bacteroidales bacterium]MDD4215123.1 DNA primase [Bacteroidales bacterium]